MTETKKRTRKARRRHIRQPGFVYRKWVLIGAVFFAFVLVGVGVKAVFNNWSVLVVHTEEVIAKAIEARVKTIMVSGVRYTEPAALKVALGLEEGSSLVGFDAGAARTRVEALGWVKTAYVVRILPSTVKVNIEEHQPIARLEGQDDTWLVAHDGQLITPATEAFIKLPLVRGLKAHKNLGNFFELLKRAPMVKERVVSAVYVGARRWDIYLKNGGVVKLPEEGTPAALAYLLFLHKERKIMDVANAEVDLRLKDRIVLKLPENASL